MVSSIPAPAEPQKEEVVNSWYAKYWQGSFIDSAEEIELGNQVQKMMILTEDGQTNEKKNLQRSKKEQ